MMTAIANLLASLYAGGMDHEGLTGTAAVILVALLVRFGCTLAASRMSFLSSKPVKRTLREMIYQKLLRLGAAYNRQVQTSEVVQVAVEGIDQLETYADTVRLFKLCGYPCRRCAVGVCAVDPHCHSGGTDLGKKTAGKLLGAIYGAGRHLPGELAGSDYAEDLSGRRDEKRGDE